MALREAAIPGRSRLARAARAWRAAPQSFRIGSLILLAHVLVAATGPFWAPYGQAEISAGMPLSGMSWAHPFGVDQLGRDILSRVVHGAHLVILLSVAGTFLGLVVGAALGLLSGYLGGWVDEGFMRLVEALISIPFLVMALLAVSMAGPALSGEPGLVIVVVAFVYPFRVSIWTTSVDSAS